MTDTKTLRDEIAIAAMQGLLANSEYHFNSQITYPSGKEYMMVSHDAYEIADDMLARSAIVD